MFLCVYFEIRFLKEIYTTVTRKVEVLCWPRRQRFLSYRLYNLLALSRTGVMELYIAQSKYLQREGGRVRNLGLESWPFGPAKIWSDAKIFSLQNCQFCCFFETNGEWYSRHIFETLCYSLKKSILFLHPSYAFRPSVEEGRWMWFLFWKNFSL